MSSIPDPASTAWVPLWDTGATGGAAFGSIPGEIKMWGGKVLPDPAKYGKWVWADGTSYSSATYPEASASIATEWKTAHGAADPGAGNFRVPDMRGVSPFGLDQMPGGARANRMTRAVSIIVAGRGGEEVHTLTLAESPVHSHVVNSHSHGGNTGYFSNDHVHGYSTPGPSGSQFGTGGGPLVGAQGTNTGGVSANHYHGINAEAPGTNNAGSGGAHENLPPAIFVPWIVRLDG